LSQACLPDNVDTTDLVVCALTSTDLFVWGVLIADSFCNRPYLQVFLNQQAPFIVLVFYVFLVLAFASTSLLTCPD